MPPQGKTRYEDLLLSGRHILNLTHAPSVNENVLSPEEQNQNMFNNDKLEFIDQLLFA